MAIRVLYRNGAARVFSFGDSWSVTEDWGLSITGSKDGKDEVVALIPPGVWETAIDLELENS